MSNNNKKSQVVNPYAKRKQPTDSRNTSAPPQRPTVPLHQQPAEVNAHASFSQTFGSVVETSHFNNELAAVQNNRSSANASSTSHITTHATSTVTPADLALLQPHVLHVSTKQRGNGLLRYIRNVPFNYVKITPDYIVGPNRCALFLSFKYHNLHPNYVHRRIAELKSDFDLRILLCLVDVEDNAAILLFLNKLCAVNNMTMILAWSEEEAARYLETFKAFEGKDATIIQKKKEVTFVEQVADTLGSIRSVNKTDSAQLLAQFGSLKKVLTANMEDLRVCPGIGEKKVRRLHEAFNKPFSSAMAKKRKAEKEKLAEAAAMDDDEEIEIAILDNISDVNNDDKS